MTEDQKKEILAGLVFAIKHWEDDGMEEFLAACRKILNEATDVAEAESAKCFFGVTKGDLVDVRPIVAFPSGTLRKWAPGVVVSTQLKQRGAHPILRREVVVEVESGRRESVWADEYECIRPRRNGEQR